MVTLGICNHSKLQAWNELQWPAECLSQGATWAVMLLVVPCHMLYQLPWLATAKWQPCLVTVTVDTADCRRQFQLGVLLFLAFSGSLCVAKLDAEQLPVIQKQGLLCCTNSPLLIACILWTWT